MIKASAFWLFALLALALPCLIQAGWDVTYPNIHTKWKRGSTHNIKWKPSAAPNNLIPATFDIYFEVNNNGHPHQYMIETVKANVKNTTFSTKFTVPKSSPYYTGNLGKPSQFVLVFYSTDPAFPIRQFSDSFEVV
ncbi:hypothetical protein BZG36_03355 [Bifiguratus adelaidae]|uniref:Uncharacterized protein n=1 Tax=Bifiguratus adelaidae TaxID=1938954 RepID=A0A261XWL7_9FUNG|nr:hypothetical protein BZG36_03355 [Bifiguratus adelaidae]